MIAGQVACDEAIVRLIVSAPGGWHREEVRAVIDTGFTQWLTLPVHLSNLLALPPGPPANVRVADGRLSQVATYLVNIDRLGEEREVLVFEMPGEPLIGMKLLEGSRLTIEAVEGGLVTIEPIA